ncbi:MAG: 4Fe-4S ferredoxin, partial [Saprospiraceae bacterium]|nr:4Fe-4S ferredoxin [Saprospiraceae bacterium]
MSRHIQVETYMSLTGSNADNRVQVSPSQVGAAVKHLYNAVASRTGAASVSAGQLPGEISQALDKTAEALVAAKGESLVVCGTNNLGEQILVNGINHLLGNYGTTITFDEHSRLRQGDESDVSGLLNEMENGRVDALFVMGANPVFELPNGEAFAMAMGNVGLTISMALLDDETTAVCQYVAPTHHGLESWGDAEPKKGHYSLMQPTIAPLFDTRQAEESLLKWSGSAAYRADDDQLYYSYLRSTWEQDMMPAAGAADFRAFWDKCLHDGVLHVAQEPVQFTFTGDVQAAAANVSSMEADGLEITLYESVNMGAGQYANNPWLMEMPDPITRCVWGN